MNCKPLGQTGLTVSTLGLGTMMFGGPTCAAESDRIIRAAHDRGINFFDTANVYRQGNAERLLGQSVKPFRDRILIATKGGRRVGEGPNAEGCSRVTLVRQVEESLARLGTDWIGVCAAARLAGCSGCVSTGADLGRATVALRRGLRRPKMARAARP